MFHLPRPVNVACRPSWAPNPSTGKKGHTGDICTTTHALAIIKSIIVGSHNPHGLRSTNDGVVSAAESRSLAWTPRLVRTGGLSRRRLIRANWLGAWSVTLETMPFEHMALLLLSSRVGSFQSSLLLPCTSKNQMRRIRLRLQSCKAAMSSKKCSLPV